jgi:hypothetical protein
LVSTKSPLIRNQIDQDEDEDEDDFDYAENLNIKNLLEDLNNNPDDCAFPSSFQNKCLTNGEVYGLLKNRSDLMKLPRTIEQQLYKPNEHMCTAIDLSMYQT